MLNPLRTSRALADLAGLESLDDPRLAISALWTVYDEQAQALDALPELARVARTMDFPLIPVLARMEWRGIRLDSRTLAAMQRTLSSEIAELQQQIYGMVGYELNIGSPAQLAEALFVKLQLPTAGIKKGKTGYSTSQKELDKLRPHHPIIGLVERYRELTKLQNTYVEALPQLTETRVISTLLSTKMWWRRAGSVVLTQICKTSQFAVSWGGTFAMPLCQRRAMCLSMPTIRSLSCAWRRCCRERRQ